MMDRAILKNKYVWGSALGAMVVALVVVGILFLQGRFSSGSQAEAADPAEPGGDVRTVEVVQPRQTAPISIEEIATVRPYYRADLRARVSGNVSFIQKNINDPVKKDEKLVIIDVPDLVADVQAREAVIQERARETDLAEKKWQAAQAAEKSSYTAIDMRKADLRAAQATEKYREVRLKRFTDLVKSGGVVESIVEEEQRDYEAAQAAAQSATVAIDKARMDYRLAQVNTEAARADVELKKALHEVAVRDKDKADALLGYATIMAPFEGVVVERNTGPGDFVQNATTAQTLPLISVDRVDLVTISMEIPDTYAPFVSPGADAEVRMGDLIAYGKVTRYSPSIDSKDRNMHVEVDLFNGTRQADYDRFRREHEATWPQERKGADDPFPALPHFTGEAVGDRRWPLLPGAVGTMRVSLTRFKNAYLIPSDTIFLRAGKSMVALVEDDKVSIKEVDKQADDGKLAKVLLVSYQSTPQGERQVLTELTGKERFIRQGQELKEGEAVKAELKSW